MASAMDGHNSILPKGLFSCVQPVYPLRILPRAPMAIQACLYGGPGCGPARGPDPGHPSRHGWLQGGIGQTRGLGRLRANFGPTLSRLWADFGPTLGRLWVDFWPTLGRLLADFGSTFGRLLADLGPTLARLWADFWPTLGSTFGPTLCRLWAVIILHLFGAVILHL